MPKNDLPLRIAMWSGPRNISTAMMRSWGSRADTYVCDEPLYAHYLLHAQAKHPGAAEVIAHHETDWRKVAGWLTGAVPQGKTIFYQKHMAHHLLPHIDRQWLDGLTHCFLIREPGEMLTSLSKFLPDPSLADTGLPQQVEIFRSVQKQTARTPPVVDAKDVLENPRRLLRRLCEALNVEFSEAMLSWSPGRRETDGIWAKYWYEAVEKSTSFQPYVPGRERLPARLADLHEKCVALYQLLYQHRLGA
jgi:Sulfotransferase domain